MYVCEPCAKKYDLELETGAAFRACCPCEACGAIKGDWEPKFCVFTWTVTRFKDDQGRDEAEQLHAREPKPLTSENATHLLCCAHAIGRSRKEYTVRCHVLKEMPDRRRLKILVFGERYWRDCEHIKHVRYVAKHKVIERKK